MNMQIKTIVILWTLVMILGACSSDSDDGTKSKSKGGDGSKASPYQIENVAQLKLVRENVTKHFKLMEDLDLKDMEDFYPIGGKDDRFIGVFDGNGKKIKNLKINEPSKDAIGFFGVVGDGGVIKNIGLEDVDVKGKISVGGLVGYNKGTIEKSYVTGKVTAEESSAGGLAGYNGGTIERSYSTASATSKTDGAGGLVGLNLGNGTKIKNSYATGAVTAQKVAGGLVGANLDGAELNNNYSTGKVTGDTMKVIGIVITATGGFLGGNSGQDKEDGKITGKNYWKKGTATQGVGRGSEDNVEEKTDKELKELDATKTGWDEAIWDFKAGEYPKLKWKSE